jgi:hypothetical protein
MKPGGNGEALAFVRRKAPSAPADFYLCKRFNGRDYQRTLGRGRPSIGLSRIHSGDTDQGQQSR